LSFSISPSLTPTSGELLRRPTTSAAVAPLRFAASMALTSDVFEVASVFAIENAKS
jgi:hypothetical protein